MIRILCRRSLSNCYTKTVALWLKFMKLTTLGLRGSVYTVKKVMLDSDLLGRFKTMMAADDVVARLEFGDVEPIVNEDGFKEPASKAFDDSASENVTPVKRSLVVSSDGDQQSAVKGQKT